jgi:hypothetical protein
MVRERERVCVSESVFYGSACMHGMICDFNSLFIGFTAPPHSGETPFFDQKFLNSVSAIMFINSNNVVPVLPDAVKRACR